MSDSRMAQKKVMLTRGTHKFRAEYLEVAGQQGIAIAWQAPGGKTWNWLTEDTSETPQPRQALPIESQNGRPVIYRNFINGTSPRAIGVGFPGGLNLAYSADSLAPGLIWTGKFIDGAPKWLERGTDNNPPAGENIVNLSATRTLPADAKFRGYQLDLAGNPTFSIQLGTQFLLDSWQAQSGALIRKLTLTGAGPPLPVTIGSHPELTIEPSAPTVTLTPNEPVTVTYRWK